MRALAERLEASDAGVAGLLTTDQCGWALRLAYEPTLRGHFSRLGSPEPHQLGPTAADTTWDRYRCDGAVHRSYCKIRVSCTRRPRTSRSCSLGT